MKIAKISALNGLNDQVKDFLSLAFYEHCLDRLIKRLVENLCMQPLLIHRRASFFRQSLELKAALEKSCFVQRVVLHLSLHSRVSNFSFQVRHYYTSHSAA